MIYLYLLALFSFDLMAQMPSTTPANPNGRWVELPKGRNYIFCGDRMFFSPHFDDKVKIGYEDGEKVASFKKHCKYRKQAVEKQAKKAEAGNETLAVSTYNSLNPVLERIPKSKKHKKHIEENGYHYKELQSKYNERDIKRLRVTNLLTPYLSQAEFEKAYAKASNNPAFIEAEYSRYASNLLTQNPAMLYTADGKLYYFSFNLSEEQLKGLGQTVGHGGGGGAGSGGGGSSMGGGSARSPASFGGRNPEEEGENPSDALEQMFSNFNSDENAMRVAPQGTRPPGATTEQTLNVPNFRQLSSAFQARQPSAGIGAGFSGSSSSGALRSRSSSRPSSSTSRRPSSVSGSSASPNLVGALVNQRGMFNRPSIFRGSDRGSGSSITRRGTASSTSSAASTSGSSSAGSTPQAMEDKNENVQASLLIDRHSVGSKSADLSAIEFQAPSDISCRKRKWVPALMAASIPNSNFRNICLPKDNTTTNQTFCGENELGKDYKDRGCLEEPYQSCNQFVQEEVSAVCKTYIDYPDGKEILSLQELKDCSETIQALFCDTIPCELKEGNIEVAVPFYNFEGLKIIRDQLNIEASGLVIDLDSTYNNHSFFREHIPNKLRLDEKESVLQSLDAILNIPDIKLRPREEQHKLSATNSPINFREALKAENWPSSRKKEHVVEDIYKIYAFYEFFSKTGVDCSTSPSPSEQAEDAEH